MRKMFLLGLIVIVISGCVRENFRKGTISVVKEKEEKEEKEKIDHSQEASFKMRSIY